MVILLIIYFIFLLALVAFNIYAILKIYSLRTAGDATQGVVLFYIFVFSVIVLISLILVSGLDWSATFSLG